VNTKETTIRDDSLTSDVNSVNSKSANSNGTNPNRARDHLANERTYLAWMRTAVAFLGMGIVIARLRYLIPAPVTGTAHGWKLGLIFGVAGLIMVLLATVHYFHVQNTIESNSYEPEKRWIIVCSIVVTIVGAGVIYYLFDSPPTVSPRPGINAPLLPE
jgi:putative membrane protein